MLYNENHAIVARLKKDMPMNRRETKIFREMSLQKSPPLGGGRGQMPQAARVGGARVYESEVLFL